MSKTQRYINCKVNYFPYEKADRLARAIVFLSFDIKDALFHMTSYTTINSAQREVTKTVNERS